MKEDGSTTKIRINFNASEKYKDAPSLNDISCKGPSINADLYSSLLKAYSQIIIIKEHKDFLQFLWYSEQSEEIISKYRFARVLFDETSSQFLLTH